MKQVVFDNFETIPVRTSVRDFVEFLLPVNASKKNFQFEFGTSAWAGGTITADTNRHTLYMNDENGDGRLDNTMLASHSNVITLTDNNYTMYLF
ncbi:MAG: hypothetical protein J6S78_06135, partial [Lachnospiraceae bacterium]|nr:hypothetical protein [Lachnospiraceae bacterium]